ncbi:hypothetical protein V6N13_100966 [Hibiscus sabdariffa]|uniref:Uncharacterized protein n=1 Tax=Hibiscus sabdariffa TaxID=183260 RepID=A0ABR2QKG4_9ROSI
MGSCSTSSASAASCSSSRRRCLFSITFRVDHSDGGSIMCRFGSVDERLDILEYLVHLLQDDAEDDVDGNDDAPKT